MTRKPYTGPSLPSDLLRQVGAPSRNERRGPRQGSIRASYPSGRKRDQLRKVATVETRPPNDTRRAQGTAGRLSKAKALPAHPANVNKSAGSDSDEREVIPADLDSDDPSDISDEGLQSPGSRTSVKRKREEEPPTSLAEPERRRKTRKQVEDDAEIAALEKKLGIKTKSLPKSFEDDGLGGLLGDLDDDLDESSSEDEGKDWLRKKRAKASASTRQDSVVDEGHNESDDAETGGIDADSSLDLETDDSDASVQEVKPKKRENPYAPAPVPVGQQVQVKYVPPSLRRAPASDTELSARLKRQLQGQLNRLSDSNMLSILTEIEKLFSSNPRGYVMSSLIELLLERLSDPAVLNDSFTILHAGFIAAVYKVVGQDFGAQLVDRFVARFDQCYADVATTDATETASNKSTVNLCSSLAQLYNLQVVNSVLIFDYVRLFLSAISETHTELLLRIVRSSGQQLRHDDPTSLKDIVLSLQRRIAESDKSTISVRTKFMLETITALKDNKLKQNAASSAATAEHLVRMKKMLGSMSKRNLRATEPLSIGLNDIREADKRGKWWLVGASWKGRSSNRDADGLSDGQNALGADEESEGDETDLLALARANRMTTPLRQRIFTALLSASDHRDAHARLTKLRLTQKQSLEIPRVLLHCAAAEPATNPYWSVVARRLCAERRLAKAFLFGAWGLYRRMGARSAHEEDSADEEGLTEEGGAPTMRETLNLATLYADLLALRALPISVLKHLNLPQLGNTSRARAFAEVLLVTTILRVMKRRDEKSLKKPLRQDMNTNELATVFSVDSIEPGLGLGLRWFLERVVAKSDLAGRKRERRTVATACHALCERLAGLRGTGDDEEELGEVDSD